MEPKRLSVHFDKKGKRATRREKCVFSFQLSGDRPVSKHPPHTRTHTHTHTHTYTFIIFAHTHMYKRIHTRLSVFPPYANSLLKLSLSLKEIQCEGQSKGGFVGVFDSD